MLVYISYFWADTIYYCWVNGIFVKTFRMKRDEYYKYVDRISPDDNSIGTDILLVDNADVMRAERVVLGRPFKLDLSMAIIYYCGEVVFNIDMRQYYIKAPAVIVVMSGQTCELIRYSDDLKSRAIVMSSYFTESLFAGSAETSMHELYMSILKNPLMASDSDVFAFNQYYELLHNIAKSPLVEFKVEASRHLTLAMFYGYSYVKHDVSNNFRGTNRQSEIYSNFLNLLSENYMKEREVRFYADKLCITAKHLSHIVKEISGKTALGIIEEYVITESKALLLSTKKPIQQIGDELNFPSQSVFGKYFKRITGVSPKEYREKF